MVMKVVPTRNSITILPFTINQHDRSFTHITSRVTISTASTATTTKTITAQKRYLKRVKSMCPPSFYIHRTMAVGLPAGPTSGNFSGTLPMQAVDLFGLWSTKELYALTSTAL